MTAVRPELVEGLVVVVGNFAELLTVGRGLPGCKFLFLSRQEKEPKEGDPDIPEFPKIEPAGRAAKNSPRLAVFYLVFCGRGSNTFAADPPGRLDFRRVCEGMKVKTRAMMTGRMWLLFGLDQYDPLRNKRDSTS